MEDKNFIYALGDSHIRALSYNRFIMPFFIGPGMDNCFLNEEKTLTTLRKIQTHIDRFDQGRHVLLSFGEPDVRLHLDNYFGTRKSDDSDEMVMEKCVERYGRMIQSLRLSLGAKLLVLNSPPSLNPEHNRLAKHYNQTLARSCRKLEVTYLDLWNRMIDKSTGLADRSQMTDYIHYGRRVAEWILEDLFRTGLISFDPQKAHDFAWNYNYRFNLNCGIEPRVWGDATLESHGEEFWNTYAAEECMKIIREVCSHQQRPSVLAISCYEGLVPLSFCPDESRSVVGIDADPNKITAARRLARFACRSDVYFTVGSVTQKNIYIHGPRHMVIDLGNNSEPTSPVHYQILSTICSRALFVMEGPGRTKALLRSGGFRHVTRIPITDYKNPNGRLKEHLLIGVNGQGLSHVAVRLSAFNHKIRRTAISLAHMPMRAGLQAFRRYHASRNNKQT